MSDHQESQTNRPMPRVKAWGILLATLAFLWVFAMDLGPWMQEQIPAFHKVVEVIIEQDIDAGAYFYTEIKGSYEGERYLRGALQLGNNGKYWGLTWPFVMGIVLCLTILVVGFKYLPNDPIVPHEPDAKTKET